jgi:hypothetical protein
MSDVPIPATEAESTDIRQDLIEQYKWQIAGYARVFFDAEHKRNAFVPYATVASVRDGTAISRLDEGLPYLYCQRDGTVSR